MRFNARIQEALTSPDANRVRVVRGQLTIQVKAVESFVNRQQKNPQTLCSSKMNLARNFPPLTAPDQIYCPLYTSSQELLKLSPVLDILLSRRGELALVRQLPLVTGERLSDPVLSLSSVQYPYLGKPAVPLSTWEPNLATGSLGTQAASPDLLSPQRRVMGRNTKTAIADYAPPVQPAIAAHVKERYPFPSLGDAKDGFNPSLALEVIGERFQLADQGMDYSFMIHVGDVPLEQLDERLQNIELPTREFLLNYQPFIIY